ncbi:MAG: hypothetical protein P8X79_01105 [Reinekea sp.]
MESRIQVQDTTLGMKTTDHRNTLLSCQHRAKQAIEPQCWDDHHTGPKRRYSPRENSM